ncbi:DUF7344 domain-containing protein [Halalkalicoccus tibetensis]|uniref:DUF7344 domain-containing protein n=1 Tax=Halalkalicoccus tibetensis TaxID=175632 RepID=A0ABD5V645_9EURY
MAHGSTNQHSSLSLDTVFELLANKRRRFALYSLLDSLEDPIEFKTLAEDVATLEAAMLENPSLETCIRTLQQTSISGISRFSVMSESLIVILVMNSYAVLINPYSLSGLLACGTMNSIQAEERHASVVVITDLGSLLVAYRAGLLSALSHTRFYYTCDIVSRFD